MRNFKLVAAAAAIAALPFMSGTSQAATCGNASVSTYTASGFSCTLGSLTFSDMVVDTTSGVQLTGVRTVSLNGGTELGLELDFIALATLPGNENAADVAWSYTVSSAGTGQSIVDAYLSMNSTVSGSGVATVGEQLSNGVSMSITNPPNTPNPVIVTFDPVDTLFVNKDESNFVAQCIGGCTGYSSTSQLVNAFSVQPSGAPPETPLPAAVWMFGSVLAGAGGVAGWRRKRKAA